MSKSGSAFLEVDSNILERNLMLNKDDSNGGGGGDDLGNLFGFNRSQKDDSTVLVTPTPGLVLKTTDDKGNKVFVNLCKVADIPEPKELSEEELLAVWNSGNDTDYRVPISMQVPHEELDKSGKVAAVYDVAINAKFFEKIKDNSFYRSFVIQLVFGGLEDKFQLVLNKNDYVILKKRTCIGQIRPQRIRACKGPYQPKRLIKEIDPASDGESEISQLLVENVDYRLLRGNKILIGQFYLPQVKHVHATELSVGDNRLILRSNANCYADVFLPCRVDENKTAAHFNLTKGTLTVLMPMIT